ncbi:MAG: LUD domain-containing protein [Candidatus Helarchaeota archaeon]|nr:LUD domain-containing protein [Candidatus Helarchaeota archaeon]
MDEHHQNLKNRITAALQNEIIIRSRKMALNSIRQKQNALKNEISVEDLKKRFRAIKTSAIQNLPTLLETAITRLRENKCQVYYASSVQDVFNVLNSIIDESQIVKSKTNASKEIDLKSYLESRQIEAIETDLGDRIVQLSQTHASHPLLPSLHIPKAQAAKLFHVEVTDPEKVTIKEIIDVARLGLRDIVLKTNIGISGANAITADEGLICLEENEGNQRLITSLPRRHIVIAGIDKVVPTAEDAIHIMKSAAYFGLGLRSGVYLSFISGPSRTGDIDFQITYGMHGPEEVHVILFDNGRRQVIDTGYEELLYCANCGGCVNYCPVYEEIGDAFGSDAFTGGRGLLYLSHAQNIKQGFENGLTFCTGCNACNIACPGSIDTYSLLLKTRALAVRENLFLPVHQKVLESVLRFSNPFSEPPSKRSEWLSSPANISADKSSTLLFLGCMASYRMQTQAQSAITLLNYLDIPFTYLGTQEPCCGSVLRNTGFEEQFKVAQAQCQQKLMGFSRILTICPGCYSTFRDTYADFLQDHKIKVQHLIEILPQYSTKFNRASLKVTYHDPCHLGRHFNIYDPPRILFKNLHLDFKEMLYSRDAARCCGAGGGVLSAFPELAQRIAKTRIEDALNTNAETLLTACPFCTFNLSIDKRIKISSIQDFLVTNCLP